MDIIVYSPKVTLFHEHQFFVEIKYQSQLKSQIFRFGRSSSISDCLRRILSTAVEILYQLQLVSDIGTHLYMVIKIMFLTLNDVIILLCLEMNPIVRSQKYPTMD